MILNIINTGRYSIKTLYNIFYIAFTLLVLSCNSSNDQDDLINKSFKKQLSSGEIDKNEIVIDSINRIYSNYKYGLAFKETRGWGLDYGVGQYTILRAYQNDSAITFIINVIEVDLNEDINMHQVVELNGVDKYKEQLITEMSKAYGGLFDVQVEKTYFRNTPATKVTFKYNFRSENETYVMNVLMYQFIRQKNIVTCGLSTLDVLFQKNPNQFKTVFDNVSILYN
jgi:hypothetical protein